MPHSRSRATITVSFRSRRRSGLAVLFAVALALVLQTGRASLQFAPSLHTDNERYAAGDEVAISGQGFAPFETIVLAVTHEDGTAEPGMGHESRDFTADEHGSVSATWSITPSDTGSRQFVVEAVGSVSGVTRSPVFIRAPRIALDVLSIVAGTPLTVFGLDFGPGEAVTVQITHAGGGAEAGMGHEPMAATAAADGSFQTAWTPDPSDLAGPSLVATASGDLSGTVPSQAFVRVGAIAPDRGDYQPGDTAVLTGSGFAPGESVALQVTHISGGGADGDGHEPFSVTANGSGGFTASWYVDPDDSLGSKFLATAMGAGSGVSASTSFWDAGAALLTTLGAAYVQDFNTLGNSGTGLTAMPLGWDFAETGTNANTTYRAGTGSDNAGDTYSFGVPAGNAERAFGTLRSGTLLPSIGAQFTNNTGAAIGSLAISFTGEIWRLGQNTAGRAADRLLFELSTSATSLTTGAWTPYTSLDFLSPVVAGTVGALVGNNVPNRTARSFSITGLNIAPGASFWIRWTDTDLDPGSDDGLAIDDFLLTPSGLSDQAPSVSSTTPSGGASNVPPGQTLGVTFSEPVTAPAAAFSLSCASSGVHALSVSGGPTTFALDPTIDFANSELCTLTIAAGQVSDQDGDDPPDMMTLDYVTSFTTAGPDAAPAVLSTLPADGANNVAIDQNVSITFSEPVAVVNPWFTLSCSSSGGHTAVVSGGPTVYTLNPATDFVFGETCTLLIDAAKVTDVDGNDPPDSMTVNFTAGFGTETDPCVLPFTHAYQIQGSLPAPAITGAVTTQGVVVGDYEGPSPALRGFFLQDATGDGDPATSDAIFVFNFDNNSVSLGDVVRVSGTATDFQDQTQVSASSVRKCGTGGISPTDISFPVASPAFLERYEGMLVRVPQAMTVTEHFQLGRFGQVLLSSDGRLPQPTNVTTPGPAANALQAQNDLRKIILDDAVQSQNPDPIPFARGGLPLSASNTLRGGDTASGIVGVLNYTWAGNAASPNAYRIRPVGALNGAVNFVDANPRPLAPPPVGGTVRVVGMNLLNFFNTFTGCRFGVGGASTDCRGANTAAEFARQHPKTVAAIRSLNPDVLGVNEIENDGYGPTSAIQFLVDQLNAAPAAPDTYAFINVDAGTGQVNAMGTDAIKVGILYKPAVVTPVGQTAALNSVAFVNGGDGFPRSRPSLAQAFSVNATGAVFIVDVNHLKSKGSECDAPDAGDGQANCNEVRVNAATALMNWLASDPTGTSDPDVLMVGDYNSYAQEDPIGVIKGAGFTNLIESFLGPDAYSYAFDGQWGYLDHALASPSLVAQVSGVADYHINADEPSVLDYNTDFKTANLQTVLYAPDQFRVSDHDPVIVGLTPNAPPAVSGPVVSPEPSIKGAAATVTAAFSDAAADAPFTCTVDHGDGSGPIAGSVSGNTCTGPSHVYAAVGSYTVTVTVTDRLGLTGSSTAPHAVVYQFSGFFSPVDNLPVFNQVNAGRAIPVKFSLGGNQGLSVFAANSPQSGVIACDASGPLDNIEETVTAGGSSLSYDPASDLYTYVWKTEKSWAGSCRQLVVTTADGVAHLATFKFVK